MMPNLFKLFLLLLVALPGSLLASSGAIKLDHARVDLTNKESIQRGAQVFTNYCLSCHSASYMRYNRLQELGLSEQQIKDNLLFTEKKPGDTMTIAMSKQDAKQWFGVAPPDLSVVARSRGADWLYTYMRSFYRDPETATGWNNLVFDKVAMPHVLYELQGEQALKITKTKGEHDEHEAETKSLELVKPGTLTQLNQGKANTTAYDAKVLDLVNFLVYMGEPAQVSRHQIGYIVLFFLILIMLPLTYFLKKEYWKDVS